MAAGDKYVTCDNKEESLIQLLRKMIYIDADGNPALHTDQSGTALEPYFTCDRAERSLEHVFREMILEDDDGNPYLNTTS
jgi:hypothetical protein